METAHTNGAPAKRTRVRNKPKRKAARTTAPAAKIDPAQALAFVRSRIRDEKDPIVKALYQRELAGLEENVKKAIEAKQAGRFITTADGKKAKIGDRVWLFEAGNEHYKGGRRVLDPPALHACVLKDVLEPEYQGGRKRAVISFVGKGGQKTLNGYHDDPYADPRTAVEKALRSVEEDIEEAREQTLRLDKQRTELLAMRITADRASEGELPTKSTHGEDARKGWSEDDDNALRLHAARGTGVGAIARAMNRSRDAVRRRLNALGIMIATQETTHEYVDPLADEQELAEASV